MAWTYMESTDQSVFNALGAVLGTLNSLSPTSSWTAKTAASDQKSGDAHGLVVFFTGDFGPIPSPPITSEWRQLTWTSSTDYASMYNHLILTLNAMPFDQAFHARISMSNRSRGEASLSLYFRLIKQSTGPIIPVNPF
jgi:hypothetical protein